MIQARNINLSTIPTIDTSSVLKDFGTLSSTTTYTSQYTGYLVGNATCPPSKGGSPLIEVSSDGTHFVAVAGFPWIVMRGDTRVHMKYCIPISVGLTIKFTCNADTEISASIYGITWSSS